MELDEELFQLFSYALQFTEIDVALPQFYDQCNENNIPDSRRIQILEGLKNVKPEFYESYVMEYGSICSDDKHQKRRFINANKKMKQVPRRTHSPPVIPIQNRFSVFQETEKPMETTDSLPIQEESIHAGITNNTILRPPPLVIREKRTGQELKRPSRAMV
ncbi:hypothetical protein JTB14_032560 [Gonioctena quinquepunctata]|nr:hypothetical protein JTB14_032560 [Gonioctena quinquepunctata]